MEDDILDARIVFKSAMNTGLKMDDLYIDLFKSDEEVLVEELNKKAEQMLRMIEIKKELDEKKEAYDLALEQYRSGIMEFTEVKKILNKEWDSTEY